MLDERFWSKVNRDTASGCWLWTANKNNKGYGMFSVSSYVGKQLAHRLAFADAHGAIPKGALVLHSCDNPRCVNPHHLRLGTFKDNVADMDQRGRRVPNGLRGVSSPGAMLSDAQVIQIRKDYVAGRPLADIATANGLRRSSLTDITLGRSWTHLLGVDGSPTLLDLKAYAKHSRKSGAKITQELAVQIRRRLAAGALGKDLAVEFGIHKATVSDIKLHKIWPD